MFGVKVGDLKPIAKRLKGQQQLALDLYKTGNSDAMYLAGLIADGAKMTKRDLQHWAKGASWYMISEYTVPGVATEHAEARDLAVKWIGSKQPSIASTGWCTYAGVVATRTDDQLDFAEIQRLLDHIADAIHDSANRVRYCMNNFVISVGSYVAPLVGDAKRTASAIGHVHVDMGATACKVPDAQDTIAKVESLGRVGKKRKTIKC